jgi:hypothetical protein
MVSKPTLIQDDIIDIKFIDQSPTASTSSRMYFIFICRNVNTQFYLYNGIDINKIKGIIDNSKSKKNKILYGTNKMVNSPDSIENMDECIVICSHTGVYYNEISQQLKSINKKIKII